MGKKILLLSTLTLILTLGACSEWTKTEPIFERDLTRTIHVDQDGVFLDPLDPANIDAIIARDAAAPYYVNLRTWKENVDHQVAFGYYGNQTGRGLDYEFSMRGLPDSVDFVSLWGGWRSTDPIHQADIRYAREVKGIKSLAVILMFEVGDGVNPPYPKEVEEAGISHREFKKRFWGWKVQNENGEWVETEESIHNAVVKYANAVADTIFKYNLDGLDIDAEPSYPQPFDTTKELWKGKNPTSKRMDLFVRTIGERIGPMAQDEKGRQMILAVDGEPEAFAPEMGKYFNYFIIQAYTDGSKSSLDRRFKKQVEHFKDHLSIEEISKKIIYVSNFEDHAQYGGPMSYTGDPQLIMFAKHVNEYDGVRYRKGGVGSFHMEYEYKVKGKNGTYPWLRQAIQIMNPQIK